MAWAELTASSISDDLAVLAGRSSSSFDSEASVADLCLGAADARSVTALQQVLHCGGLRCVHDLLLLPGLSQPQEERAETAKHRHTAA
eukprot:9722-Heterococcus_DN1.PRE.1